MRFWFVITASVLACMAPAVGWSQALTAAEALDRYLAMSGADRPLCSDSTYAVKIEASLPALKKYGSMTGFKRIMAQRHVVYRGLRFTGDNLVKTRVIARYLAHEADPAVTAENTDLTRANYTITFSRVSDYNGLIAYVFLLKPRRKRVGLVRGELWLNGDTAAPLRFWGDLVKSPSIFIRSLRLVQDYQTAAGCTDPLRLLLTARTRIAGTVEMTVWLAPSSEKAEEEGVTKTVSDSSIEVKRDNEDKRQH